MTSRNFYFKAISIISSLFKEICKEQLVTPTNGSPFTVPSQKYSIKKYILRLVRYTNIEESTLIIMWIYIDRICARNHYILNYSNIYRIILGAFVSAVKYNEDEYYDNTSFAKLGGWTWSELNKIEYNFIVLIGFSLYISDEIFRTYYDRIASIVID